MKIQQIPTESIIDSKLKLRNRGLKFAFMKQHIDIEL